MPATPPREIFMMWAYPAFVVAIFATGAAQWLWFVALPERIRKGKGPTARDRLRPYLNVVLATPSLRGGSIKVPARLMLLQLHIEQARHAEVIATCHRLLAAGLTPGFESTTRHHLADSLDALGDPDAADERRRARDCLKGVGDDFVTFHARGKLLNKENRHLDAYDQFERGLELIPDGTPSEVKVQFLMQMALAAFNAGWIEDGVRGAERAIAEGAEGDLLRLAHRHLGNCLLDLGRLEDSELHNRKAYEVAVALREPSAIADSLADFAEIRRKRGKLAEALAACEEAEAAYPDKCRRALLISYQIMKDWGRFDEASAFLERARTTNPLAISHYERRMQALYDMGDAWIALDTGLPDRAEAFVRRAWPACGDDEKLSLWLLTTTARIAALRGDREAYIHAFEQAERRVGGFSGDHLTQRGALTSLGKAALVIGDFSRGLDCWDRYLSLEPHPVDLPTGYYHLGLCHEGLGDLLAARAAFREAVAPAVDTHYARLAESRLQTLLIG